jgi:hypothetical protein
MTAWLLILALAFVLGGFFAGVGFLVSRGAKRIQRFTARKALAKRLHAYGVETRMVQQVGRRG